MIEVARSRVKPVVVGSRPRNRTRRRDAYSWRNALLSPCLGSPALAFCAFSGGSRPARGALLRRSAVGFCVLDLLPSKPRIGDGLDLQRRASHDLAQLLAARGERYEAAPGRAPDRGAEQSFRHVPSGVALSPSSVARCPRCERARPVWSRAAASTRRSPDIDRATRG